ncbi:MAG TPA: hypothetical protein VG269_18120 [Tepidisphaeraceae bacterium]|jgi:hypothetical protein|nr:hypothetical protein [Tepidisphaeraceae bacterium]
MSSAKEKPVSDFTVDDPAAAFRKLEAATRKFLAAPKSAVGSSNAKQAKKPKRR